MNTLYRRITTPNGRHRYEPIPDWDTGKPADGLWIVKRSGDSKTWLSHHIAIRPDKLESVAWIADHLDDIAEIIQDCRHGPSSHAIALMIVNKLMEEV